MKNKFQTLLALVVVLGLLIAAMPADRAQAQTPQTLQVAQWSTPVTLANVSGRPAVVYDGTNYHLWYTVTESGSLVYTSSTMPDSFTAGAATTGLGASQSSPAVMKEGDTFYMINYGAIGETEFDLYTSANGVDWTNAGVVYAGDGLTDYAKFDAPSLLKDTNGYKLYFQVKSSATGNPYSIYVATSTVASLAELVGTPFTGGTLALAPGASGAWDADRVQHPMVVKDGDAYYMWYVGYPVGLTQKLGVATSSDGITWTKGANNPIISTRTAEPSVVKVGDIWHLWYLSTSPSITYISANMPFVVPQSSVYATIQAAINAAAAGDTINVTAGTYVEDVNVNKAITLVGAGADVTKIVGTTGMKTPLTFATSGALVRGFTLTHEYTEAELAAWDNTTINNNGVTFNQNTAGNTLENCTVTLNRNGIYLNNTQNSNVITGNTITNNRTGINTSNNINGTQITNNMISGNWTLGFVYYSQGIATDFSTVILTGNTFDSNWYSEILIKDAGTSAGTFDVSGNTFTDVPVTFSTSADPSLNEPSFVNQKPVALGGTATKPEQELPTIRIYNSSSVSFQTGPKTLLVGAAPLFTTIQSAIDAASDGDTINVAAGTYAEDLTINKAVTLLGPNAEINPNTGVRTAEAVLLPATSATDPYGTCEVMSYVSVSGVTIKGFTFEGDNPNLTSGVDVFGTDADACEIIAGYEGVGDIVIENNILQHSTYAGIDFYNYTNSAATSNNTIRYNLIKELGETVTYNWGVGVLVYNNFYADVTDNVIDNVRVGVQTGNFEKANPGPTGKISNNVINAYRTGIFHNLWYSNASSIPLSDNTITAVVMPGITKWNGIALTSFQGATSTVISNNSITIPDTITFVSPGYAAGYNIWNTPTTATITINGGVVEGGDYGIFVNNFEGYSDNADNTSVAIDGVTIRNAKIAGIYVKDSPSNTNGSTVHADILGSQIEGADTGILVEGSDATATAHWNRIVNSTTAGLTNTSGTLVDATNNWWGCNAGPADAACDSVSDMVNADPWLTLTLTADQSQMTAGGTINLVASLTTNSNGEDTSTTDAVIDGIPVAFVTTYGTLNPTSGATTDGSAGSALAIPDPIKVATATVTATVDGQVVSIDFGGGHFYIYLPFIVK
jgi:parallel beta-helix repeat protein